MLPISFCCDTVVIWTEVIQICSLLLTDKCFYEEHSPVIPEFKLAYIILLCPLLEGRFVYLIMFVLEIVLLCLVEKMVSIGMCRFSFFFIFLKAAVCATMPEIIQNQPETTQKPTR